MQYLAGIFTALVVGLGLGSTVGTGLMPVLVALGLGLMAYGLVDKQMKKREGGDNGAR